MPRTLLLMADDRLPVGFGLHRAPVHALSAVLNLEYALRHGYDFRYYWLRHEPGPHPPHDPDPPEGASALTAASYQLDVVTAALDAHDPPSRIARAITRILQLSKHRLAVLAGRPAAPATRGPTVGCSHPAQGPRAPSWAKLLCVEHALRGETHDLVVYADTDTYFPQIGVGVDSFLDRHACRDEVLVVPDNFPWTRERDPVAGRDANAGFMIWRRGPEALRLVRDWWHAEGGAFNLAHDWEQAALQHHVLKLHGPRIRIVRETTLREQPGQFLRHVGSAEGALRLPRLRRAAFRQGMTTKRWAELSRRLARRHLHPFGTRGLEMAAGGA